MRKELFKHEIAILKDTFGRLLRRHAQTNLVKLINKTHPADLAIVFRYFNDEEQKQVFSLIQTNDHTVEFLVELDDMLIEKIRAVMRIARVTSFQCFSNTCWKKPLKSNSSPIGAIIATAINNKTNPKNVSGRKRALRSTIYSGAGKKDCIILSNSSDKIITPVDSIILCIKVS